jgi:hypothetical protein
MFVYGVECFPCLADLFDDVGRVAELRYEGRTQALQLDARGDEATAVHTGIRCDIILQKVHTLCFRTFVGDPSPVCTASPNRCKCSTMSLVALVRSSRERRRRSGSIVDVFITIKGSWRTERSSRSSVCKSAVLVMDVCLWIGIEGSGVGVGVGLVQME